MVQELLILDDSTWMKAHQWARVLAYVSGLVNQELLLQVEYLSAENRILRPHLPDAPFETINVQDTGRLSFEKSDFGILPTARASGLE